MSTYRERKRAKQRQWFRNYMAPGLTRTDYYRALVFNHYGVRCEWCRDSFIDVLTIDHIDGGGRRHRAELKGNSIYKWLIDNEFPTGFQTLCAGCNSVKGKNGRMNTLPPERKDMFLKFKH